MMRLLLPVMIVLSFALTLSRDTAFAQSPIGTAKTDGSVTLQSTGGFFQASFANKDGSSVPVFNIGYQDRLDEKIDTERKSDPDVQIHDIPLVGFEIRATPSGDTASLFQSDQFSTGTHVSLSVGLAFLFSHRKSLTEVVLEQDERELQTLDKQASDATTAAEVQNTLGQLNDAITHLQAQVTLRQGIDKTNASLPAYERVIQDAKNLKVIIESHLSKLTPAQTPDSKSTVVPSESLKSIVVPSKRPILSPIFDSLNFQVGWDRNRYTLFDPTLAYANQFSKKDFSGYSAQASYNANFGGRIPKILGLSVGVAHNNNADDLKAVQATDQQVFTSPDGSVQRTIQTQKKGLQGDYKESTVTTLKTDFIFYPDLASASKNESKPRSSVALDLFTRSTLGSNAQFVPGIGVYITQPGDPLKVYGGLNVYKGSDNKVAIDIVSGYNF